MRSRSVTRLTLALLLVAASASAASATGRSATPGAPLAALENAPPIATERAPAMAAATPCEPAATRLIAEVVAIDARAGIATVSTPHGLLELKATAATLAQLDVGDRLVVELVDELAVPEPDDPICI